MAIIDYDKKEVNAKIVYYGPALSGKTSNIHYIYSKLVPEHRGELMTLSTKSHRTLFFDFLPVELGEVKGLNTRFYLYTVPGQIFYNNIRKQVLRDVDGIVFVADSQTKMKNDNIQSFQNLEENLAEQGRSLKDIPHVLQYNKRDMPDILSAEDLHRQLNKYNAPHFEATALNGNNVLKTLTTISKMVLKKLREGEALQTKTEHEGPKETYGLTDDFIAMKVDEANKLKAEMEAKGEQPVQSEAASQGTPTPEGPTPPEPEQTPQPQPAQAPGPPAQQQPPPPAQEAQKPPEPPTPSRPQAPPPSAPPPPQEEAKPAPPPSPPPPVQPPPPQTPPQAAAQPAQPSQLVLAKWGNPQAKQNGVIKLPAVFKDKNTGAEYETSILIQLNPLVPKK